MSEELTGYVHYLIKEENRFLFCLQTHKGCQRGVQLHTERFELFERSFTQHKVLKMKASMVMNQKSNQLEAKLFKTSPVSLENEGVPFDFYICPTNKIVSAGAIVDSAIGNKRQMKSVLISKKERESTNNGKDVFPYVFEDETGSVEVKICEMTRELELGKEYILTGLVKEYGNEKFLQVPFSNANVVESFNPAEHRKTVEISGATVKTEVRCPSCKCCSNKSSMTPIKRGMKFKCSHCGKASRLENLNNYEEKTVCLDTSIGVLFMNASLVPEMTDEEMETYFLEDDFECVFKAKKVTYLSALNKESKQVNGNSDSSSQQRQIESKTPEVEKLVESEHGKTDSSKFMNGNISN